MTASTNQINERKPLRCIVADDHAATRQGASEILTAQGDIEVVASASDGPEAVHLISHYLPDLAIIDVLMPGQGGLDVCHEVREAGLPTAVLIYTGFPDPEVVRACLEAGARGFVLKSAQAEELLRAVRTIAAGDTYVDHTATQGEAEAPADSHRSVLSKREREVLQLLADGRTNDQAADALGLSPATVRTYVENAMQAQGRQSDPRGRRGRPPRPNRLTDASDLERSNRALSEAAYLIAHDLAEPLRAVSGFAGLLERRYGGRLDDAADEHLAHIVAGTRRMHAMLAGLSAFVASERAPLESEKLDVAALVGSLASERMARLDELGGEIAVGDLPGARADARLARELFARLLDNAIRFRGEAPLRVEIVGERAGDQARYADADRGIGVPAGEEESVVKLFRRASNAADHAGVGVGLAIAERIAERTGEGSRSPLAREGAR